MKNIVNTKQSVLIGILAFFLFSATGWSQPKKIKPPKRISKVESVDQFVEKTFQLYHKVFVYDSLTQAGVEVPPEIEDELIERAGQDADSLWQTVPDILDDISDAPFLRQAKATLNLNKAKKAIKYCAVTAKAYFIPAKEEDDE